MPLKIDDILQRGNVKVLEDPDEIFKFLQERRRRQSACPAIRMTEDAFIVELDGASGLVDKRVKLPTEQELRRLTTERGIPWRDDFAGRFEQFWTSDERVDGAGDIVRQSWDFSRYEKLSRVLHAHNWGGLPVGRSVMWDVRDRTDGKEYKGPALYQVFLFATADMNPEAAKIHALVKSRFLTETSVGFFPLKILHVEDDKDRKELGLGRWGVVFERNQLVETSTCAVACNDGAQIAAGFTAMRDEGILEAGDLDLIRSLVADDGTKSVETRNATDAAVCGVFKELFPESGQDDVDDDDEDGDESYVTAADLRRVGAELREELFGVLNNLKTGLVDLYDKDESTEDEDEDEEDDDEDLEDVDEDDDDADDHDDLDDEDDEDPDEDYEVEDDEDDEDEDEPGGDGDDADAEPVGAAYLDTLFGG